MTNHTQEQLQTLLEQNPDEFIKVLAEVCYGKPRMFGTERYYYDGDAPMFEVNEFNPLAKTALGRSQAFELADEFKCFPCRWDDGEWVAWHGLIGKEVKHRKAQAAICIASILTAQGVRK